VDTDGPDSDDEGLGRAVGELAGGRTDRVTLAQVARLARDSMKAAGARSLATGQWLAETALDTIPHIPVRDAATLSAQHGGLTGDRLADEVVRSASRTTAGMGAVAGALASAHQLAPPTWAVIPAELLVETLAVVAAEMKLVAELQEVYGMPVEGAPNERSVAIVRAWAEGRGVTARNLVRPGGLSQVLGRGSRRELVHMLQRRLAMRTMRNMSALVPLMAGAVAGAELNRRATRSLGEKVVRDLSSRARTGVA
jgi:uncharacterized protein (DUF697 family)